MQLQAKVPGVIAEHEAGELLVRQYGDAEAAGAVGLAGLFGLFVMKAIWPSLNDAFGVMLSTGFYGGHGTAAAMGVAFHNLG